MFRLLRRISAVTACAIVLTLTGCTNDDTPTPTADPAEVKLAAQYVAAFNAAGEAMDAIEAAGAWGDITGPKDFNTFAGFDNDPYTLKRLTSDGGIFWWCVHDTSNDIYAAAATGPAVVDPQAVPAEPGQEAQQQAAYTVGFGSGTACRYDTRAPVLVALDDNGVYPLDTKGTLVDEVAAQLTDLRAELTDPTAAEAVVSYAVRDLSAALPDLDPQTLPAKIGTPELAAAGLKLPAGVLVHDFTLTTDDVDACLAHTQSGAWAHLVGDPDAPQDLSIERGATLDDSCVTG